MGLIERFSNNNEMVQKARAYDDLVKQSELANVRADAHDQGMQKGLYAAMVARANANAAAMQEAPVVLPNGEVVSAEQARGLASQMAQVPQSTYRR